MVLRESVRDVMVRAPGWARNKDGLAGRGEPRGGGSRATWDFPTDAALRYYDLSRALKLLREGGKGCPKRPPDARTLALLVEHQWAMVPYSEIASLLRAAKTRRLRGGELWNTRGVAHGIERAYTWLCDPKKGRFLTSEEWEIIV